MARNSKPSAHKPVFDEESILRFAALGSEQSAKDPQAGADHPERHSLSLQLKPEIIKLLRAEADRKGKTVEQIVAKLVSKHLGKH
jgi:hypothetical protein